MAKKQRTRWGALKSFAKIRRNALRAIDAPGFAQHELQTLDAAAVHDLPGFYCIRGRGNSTRFFRVEPGACQELELLLATLQMIDFAANQYDRLKKSKVATNAMDDLALRCLWIGSYATSLDIKFGRKRASSKGGKNSKKMTEAELKAVQEFVNDKCRGGGMEFGAALKRAHVDLRTKLKPRRLRDVLVDPTLNAAQ